MRFYLTLLNIIPHSTVSARINDKMRNLFYYNHQTAYDYSLWIKLLFDLEYEDIRFEIVEPCVTGIRSHPHRMSNDNTESDHYWKWIPMK